jgi:hypothetical protein
LFRNDGTAPQRSSLLKSRLTIFRRRRSTGVSYRGLSQIG